MNKSSVQYIGENKRAQEITGYLNRVGVASTSQLARGWFSNYAQPEKKARKWIMQGVEARAFEVHRSTAQHNLYRLSKEVFEIIRPGKKRPNFTKGLDHRLRIADILIDLMAYETPQLFLAETRQPFEYNGNKYVYAPDIICTWQEKWLTIESQLSPMSSDRWSMKWEVHKAYWKSEAYKKADWQPDKPVKPRIVVFSTQMPETVRAGASDILRIEVVRTVADLYAILQKERDST